MSSLVLASAPKTVDGFRTARVVTAAAPARKVRRAMGEIEGLFMGWLTIRISFDAIAGRGEWVLDGDHGVSLPLAVGGVKLAFYAVRCPWKSKRSRPERTHRPVGASCRPGTLGLT